MAETEQRTKATHVFELEDHDSSTETNTYAFVHMLGSEDLVVTARDRQGKPVLCESQVQDENVMIVKRTNGAWAHGDKIMLLG